MMNMDTDVLIVGAGTAGLVTALNARGRRVCILLPGGAEEPRTASDCAQGGIAAAVGTGDSPHLHIEDTMAAGDHRNAVAAVGLACHEAPAAVRYLESLGVAFARTGEALSLHQEAAHCKPRVLHAGGDATGAAIMQALRREVLDAPHVEFLPDARALALWRDSTGIHGVAAATGDGRTLAVRARDVVIATGGIGGLYSRSTNPPDACGDGPAMALMAGARCDDLEFVQFHPTALDIETRPLPLLTEALRGAGATLIDDRGLPIMRDVHPLGDLAPRDVVARAVYAARRQGSRVWLDATQLAGVDVADAFPAAYRLCSRYGFDLRRDAVPVTPAAHYHMGGIAVDLDGRTTLPNLWAVGEAACTGLHGANRLASNSLLEAVVFGRRVGQALRRMPYGFMRRNGPTSCVEADPMPPGEADRELREIMWRCMGLVRNVTGLVQGLTFVARQRERLPEHAAFRHARLMLVEHMMRAALVRRESCGAHWRDDARPLPQATRAVSIP